MPAPHTPHPTGGLSSLFLNIYTYFQRRKVLGAAFLVGLLSTGIFLTSRLHTEEDINKLLPAGEATDLTSRVLKQVNFADDITVLVQSEAGGSPADLTEYAARFTDSLAVCCTEEIAEVKGKINDRTAAESLDFVYENLPLFLTEEDYTVLAGRLQPDSLRRITADNYRTLVSPVGSVARTTILRDPLGLTFLGLEKFRSLQSGDDLKLYNNYLISRDEESLLLLLKPDLAAGDAANGAVLADKLYALAADLNTRFEDRAVAEFYGAPLIAAANAHRIKSDIQSTVAIAMTVLLLLLIFFYQRLTVPLILLLPAVAGALTGASVLYLWKGTVSGISLGIGAVLLGITLDYGLHILTVLRREASPSALYRETAGPILLSSLTTAAAFLCLVFLRSEALRDLGIFAAVSVASAAFFALLLIPHFYGGHKDKAASGMWLDRAATVDFSRSKIALAVLASALAASCFYYRDAVFNQDITRLNYQTEALLSTEKKLDALINTKAKSVYLVAYGETEEAALQSNESIFTELQKAEKAGEILSFGSAAGVLLSQKKQMERIARWDNFWTKERQENTKNQLLTAGEALGMKVKTFAEFYALTDRDFRPLTRQNYGGLNADLLNNFISEKSDIVTVVSLVKVAHDRAEALVKRFADMPGTIVIDRQHLNETFLGNLRADFGRLAGYSLTVVFGLLLLYYRRLELALLTMLPILLTALLLLGTAGFFGLEFNVFNIVISSFIFGLGVDYAIFTTNGLMHEYRTGRRVLPTYRTAIILSVLTTVAGIGSLIFARHPALTSVSAVSLVGIAAAVGITFILQPRLFRFLTTHKTDRGLAPVQLRTSIHGFLLFAWYGIGSLVFSLYSVTLMQILPFKKRDKIMGLSRAVSLLYRSVLAFNPFVKKKIINPHGETFTKPAILIANHASALDTILISSVTYRIIYLVNDWVYKSPVFGLMVRVAGYYPVSAGITGSLEHLRKKTEQGFSLVIFPEGQRSPVNKIARFRKGAFFLQEKLNLDIIPLYLHGNAEVLPKGDRVIYDGSLTLKIGERIPAADLSFGEDVFTRAKKISDFYRTEHQKLRDQIEDADYFKGILLDNYLYKDRTLYRTVKADFAKHKDLYKKIRDTLPLQGKIAHIAADRGQIDILSVAHSPERRLQTFISDPDSRRIARRCYTTAARGVVYADTLTELKPSEILLISDPDFRPTREFAERFEDLKQVITVNNPAAAEIFEKTATETELISLR